MLVSGDRWRFDDGVNYIVAEIDTIDWDNNTVKCKIIESDYIYQDVYFTFAIAADAQSAGLGGMDWKCLTPKLVEYGVTCIKCEDPYPYAVKIPNFKCWACRHGY